MVRLGFLVLILIVTLAIFLALIVIPRRVWGLAKSWRYKNPDVVEPSDLAIWWYRISGVVGVILLVNLGMNMLTDYRDLRRQDRCEAVLPELRTLLDAGGVPAVERRARDLGLEVEDRTYGSPAPVGNIVITEDGEPFATLAVAVPNAFCNA